MQEDTLAIIKPDATRRNIIGAVVSQIEQRGLVVAAAKMLRLTREQAEGFYHVHQERPFFSSLVKFMSEGPILVLVLRGENAVSRWREIMGATDPSRAGEGSIRRLYGENIERNAVHGSDSPESARFEIPYFFGSLEIVR